MPLITKSHEDAETKMKLRTVELCDFKSVAHTELLDCEDFNVLVGKNNSGKSNILSGIVFFFTHLHADSLVSAIEEALKPSLFHQTDEGPANKSQVALTFVMSADEIQSLLNEIETEAPQIKNTLESMRSHNLLHLSLSVIRDPFVAFVDKVEVSPSGAPGGRMTLLSTGDEAGRELAKRHLTASSLHSAITAAERNATRVADRDEISRTYALNRAVEDISGAQRIALQSRLERTNPSRWRDIFEEVVGSWKDELKEHDLEELSHRLTTFTGEATTVPDYIWRLLDRVKSIRVLYLSEQRRPVGSNEAQQLLRLKVRRGGNTELQAIQATVKNLLSVQVDAFESATPRIPAPRTFSARPTNNALSAEMDVDNFLVQINGSGVREALRLILDVRFQEPDILLVEEPEVHLHPALEFNVLQYLKQQSQLRQIFITTHSTNFLDSAETSSVFLVAKPISTTARKIALDSLDEEIPRELGLRLSSVFMFDRLLFVEGPSDEAILRQLAFRMKIDFGRQSIGFVRMGGARNFAHYANASTMSILSRRQVKVWFVIDRDERTEEEISRLASMCGDWANLHILARRELENYLLDPAAIAKFIAKKTNGQSRPTADEVGTALSEVAEELKATTVAKMIARKYCTPLYFDMSEAKLDSPDDIASRTLSQLGRMSARLAELASSVESDVSKMEVEMSANWSERKLVSAPGTELLDGVAKRFGCRYRKDRDGAIIASFMEPISIDSNLQRLLREVVTG
ncbi:AAA family ATPase [Micromonospora sp. NPDC049240]|uniref:AAA family ATPase n=1 Tax=Micromonospora sp. NPDC049240 TaxID=3155151 RepID=UPI0033F8CD0A